MIINGDCLEELGRMEANSVDAIVTDPPYEIGFMGNGWDNAGVSFRKETWEKCLRVLKPGGYLVSFGGTRTYHRIACAIEDAGFEIRDSLMWLFGGAMPKSMNISKAIESREKYGKANTVCKKQVELSGDGREYKQTQRNNGIMGESKEFVRKEYTPTSAEAKKWENWGTALKPGYEPIILARKSFAGSLTENVITNGLGGLNIGECRIESSEGETVSAGRFPANVILSYDDATADEVIGGFPNTKGGGKVKEKGSFGYCFGEKRSHKPMADGYNDSGSAARYFKNCQFSEEELEENRRYYYCPKASRKDRDEGLDDFEIKTKVFNGTSDKSSKEMKPIEQRFTTKLRNIHPTVKPTSLMRWLIRLVCPRGAVVLDPFMGSGSTGKAVALENKERGAGYNFIGIEKEAEYCKIAQQRITFIQGE